VSGRLYADKHSSESSLTAFSRQVFYFLNNGGGATTLFIASFGGLFIYRPLTWLWSLLIALSLYIHAQLSVQSELTEIDSELNGIPGWTDDAVVLNSKLATLESAEALCGRASQKIKPIIFLSISLLVLGLLFVIIGLSYYGPTMLPWAFGAAVEEQENILIAAWRAGTPAVLLSAGLLLIWSIYQRSKLSSMVAYIRGEAVATVAKKRILLRLPNKSIEYDDLKKQLADLVASRERSSTRNATSNAVLLALGVLLSTLITIASVLGGTSGRIELAGLALAGGLVSGVLSAIVTGILAIQSTFRFAEKSAFQQRIANDAGGLIDELVLSVDNDEKFKDVVTEYRKLRRRSIRVFGPSRNGDNDQGQGQTET